MGSTGVNYNLSNHENGHNLTQSDAQPRMKVSVIIPAHNEQEYLPAGLNAVAAAAKICPHEVETVVVLNRCTDRTEEIARGFGAVIAKEDAKNLSRIRNAGAAASSGDIIVTIDADSQMHPQFLRIIVEKLAQGRDIGGGNMILPERWSLGIIACGAILFPHLAKHKVSFGAFWTTRKTFDHLGGFNADFVTIEDVDFAIRMRDYAKSIGKKTGTVWTAPMTTSCRKFDQYGDWHIFKDRGFMFRVLEGTNTKVANEYWYDQRSG
ncbi:MAG: glycosyl transferase family 2 [Verrucomicrobiales bacterium]|nr:glycosyl transferase family 2 [Verrucomicrobiales bacterium]